VPTFYFILQPGVTTQLVIT